MDGARIVNVVKGDKDVVSAAQRKLPTEVQRTNSGSGDEAVKLSLKSKLELISDVKEFQANRSVDSDDSAFAVRALTYVNKLAGKVQKLLDESGPVPDARKEKKVQELLNELARVVGYNGGSSDFKDLASGAVQISGSLEGVLRRGDSAAEFAKSLDGAASFYSTALVEKVSAGAAESVSRFANNLSDISAVTKTYLEGGVDVQKVSGELVRLSGSALVELGRDEIADSPEGAAANIIKYFQDVLANQNGDLLNFGEAKKLLSRLVSQIKNGVNIDELARGTTDRVA